MMSTAETTTHIPALLRQQGRSVVWFCRQVGIHRTYYWMMERGRRPLSAAYVSRAADVLGVPVALLYTAPVDDDEASAA